MTRTKLQLTSRLKQVLPTLAIAVFLLPLTAWSEIYKHLDQHGNVVFSDSPSKESTKIELKELPIINFPTPPAPTAAKADPKTFRYTTFEIASPSNQQTLRDNNGAFQVSLAIQPALKKSHSLQLFLDGSQSPSAANGTQFSLSGIDRGTHTVHAKVFDKESQLIQSTAKVTVHLHKFSSLHRTQRTR